MGYHGRTLLYTYASEIKRGGEGIKVELPLEVEMGVMSLLFLLAGAVLGWIRAPVPERYRRVCPNSYHTPNPT